MKSLTLVTQKRCHTGLAFSDLRGLLQEDTIHRNIVSSTHEYTECQPTVGHCMNVHLV